MVRPLGVDLSASEIHLPKLLIFLPAAPAVPCASPEDLRFGVTTLADSTAFASVVLSSAQRRVVCGGLGPAVLSNSDGRATPSGVDPAWFKAENGEDRWLDRFFGGKRQGFFVEIGAHNGIYCSNSYYFGRIGWRGLLVEADPSNAALCRLNRPEATVFDVAVVASADVKEIEFCRVDQRDGFSTTNLNAFHRARLEYFGWSTTRLSVPARTLDSILLEAGPPHIDFLSIDVEEAEYDVLRGCNLRRWMPTCIVIENNHVFRPRRIKRLLIKAGYTFRDRVRWNDIYVYVGGNGLARWLVDAVRILSVKKLDFIRYMAKETVKAAIGYRFWGHRLRKRRRHS